MAVEIEVERRPVAVVADQPLEHPDHLGALFIDRGGVEIVDLVIAVGPRRVGEGAGILAELARAQRHHVLDPLHRRRAQVRGELLVAEHRQPFLEAELEPVAAGDAVAGPVVEILVRDHRLDALIVAVGRGLGRGEHELGVEDVQPLVLHRAHVEVVHGDDVEHVEVVFAPVDLFVPAHRLDEAFEREARAVLVARAHPDVQRDLAPRHGGEAVRDGAQVARDEGEEIGGLGPRVVPFGPAGPAGDRVAVRQQHRQVGADGDPERRHHVGAVGIPGDVAEALGLALGAEHPAREIEPLERGVGLGVDLDGGREGERPLGQRRGGDGHRFVGQRQGRLGDRRAVDRDRNRPQPGPAVEGQVAGGNPLEPQVGLHPRAPRGQRHVEPRFMQAEGPGAVFAEESGLGHLGPC